MLKTNCDSFVCVLTGDTVAFHFTLLDPKNHKRSFDVHLDASKSDIGMSWCRPSLPAGTVKSLMSALNEDRDLGAFVKGIRAAFVELVENEVDSVPIR